MHLASRGHVFWLSVALTSVFWISGEARVLARQGDAVSVATAMLIRGIDGNNPRLIRRAVEQGADVNALGSIGGPAKFGLTALMIAADTDTDTVRLLLSKGAHVNYRGNLGTTALMCAATPQGNVTIVRLLLDKGAHINAKNDMGFTPLMFAASNGKLGIVRLLLSRHADVNTRGTAGFTALTLTPKADIAIKMALQAAGAH